MINKIGKIEIPADNEEMVPSVKLCFSCLCVFTYAYEDRLPYLNRLNEVSRYVQCPDCGCRNKV